MLNARNLVPKRLDFQSLVADHGLNCIFAVTETWFTQSDNPDAWSVDRNHFKCFVKNRDLEATRRKRGGGVMLMIPNFLKPIIRTDISHISTTFESLWVECNSFGANNSRILINVSYFPHKRHVDIFFDHLASDISSA